MSNENKQHISSFASHALVLIGLLILTTITVVIAEVDFGRVSIAVALLVAAVKGTVVLSYFMHLKFESRFIRGMVLGIFALYIIVIIITFFDYSFR